MIIPGVRGILRGHYQGGGGVEFESGAFFCYLGWRPRRLPACSDT